MERFKNQPPRSVSHCSAHSALSMLPALVAGPPPQRRAIPDYFILVHASGGWDVTLVGRSADRSARPRRSGVDRQHRDRAAHALEVEDARGRRADVRAADRERQQARDGPRHRRSVGPAQPLDRDQRPRDEHGEPSRWRCGVLRDRAHLSGGHSPASSIDVALANRLGAEQLLPAVAVQFPSSFIGDRLDRRAAARCACDVERRTIAQVASSATRGYRTTPAIEHG